MMKLLSFAPLALLALMGCSDVLGSESTRRPALIEFPNGGPVVVEVPTTVKSGTVFQVAINSYGGNCIGQGPSEVAVEGLTATVAPFQFELVDGNSTCTQEIRTYRNVSQLRFDQTGTARILFRGRSQSAGGELITVERTLTVTN
jgi:hypothetical protein